MKTTLTVSTLLATLFLSIAPAQAASFIGTRAALDARDGLIREFVEGRSHEIAFRAMDRIVELSTDALAREGRPDLAAHFRKAWDIESTKAFRRHFFDIGDHEPLSRVLADLAVVLKKVLGKDSKYADLIKDVEIMNYAIPVVLAPAGDWQKGSTARNRGDYAEHFVPFSGIIAYYASLGACQGLANRNGLGKLGKKYCPPIAARLEREMRDRLAPKLASFIFDKANGTGNLVELRTPDFAYLTEASLEKGLL